MSVQEVAVREIPLAEAALAIRRTWHAAYALALAGELRARRVGKRWLVDRASVDEFLARHGDAAPTQAA